MDSAERYDAAIIGAGLAGATVVCELAVRTPPGFRALILGAAPPGPGTAYAVHSDRLFMNGAARAMSAAPSDKTDLLRWLGDVPPKALISRRRYGVYLTERFRSHLRARPEFAVAATRAVDLAAEGSGFVLTDQRGQRYRASQVVLALGNFPPDDAFLPEAVRAFDGFVPDPWTFDGRLPPGDALIVGSGLTAMDALALLEERGFAHRIHVVSRHGLIPATEDARARPLDPTTLALRYETPHALLRSFRAAVTAHQASAGDWRDLIETIRSLTPAIWAGWSIRERRRFLRHLQAFWAIHRYRVPPETAAAHARFERAGRVEHLRGRIAGAQRHDARRLNVEVATSGGRATLCVAAVVNCTGPNGDYRRVNDPLVRTLIGRGIIRPDALHLGLDASSELHPLDRRGRIDPRLFSLGPPLRGLFYESTAVPETIAQAATVAEAIAGAFAASRLSAAS